MYQAITGTGDGGIPVVNLTFDYLSKDHVKAAVDAVEVAFTWAGASQITFSAAVAAGAAWSVYRETPIDTPLVDFTNGSVLTETDLDLAGSQHLYIAQELDARLAAGIEDTSAALAASQASAAAAEASVSTVLPPTRAAMADLGAALGTIVTLKEAGREGLFRLELASTWSAEMAADTRQGIFVPSTSDATKVWRRLFLTGQNVKAEWFGAVGDGITDDHAAFQGAIDALALFQGGQITAEAKTYKIGSQLLNTASPITLTGSGSSVQPGAGTVLKFPAGLSGALDFRNGVLGKGAGSRLQNLIIEGSGTVAVSDADAALGVGAGVLWRNNGGHVSDVYVTEFEGNGFYILSSIGAPDASINGNNGQFDNLHVASNLKNGFATRGSDSNHNSIRGLDASNNGAYGVYENSFLGNIYQAPHFSGNAADAPILIGANSGYSRFYDAYKEVHPTSTLLFRTTAGGAGRNIIHFHSAEGSSAAPSTFTIDDGVSDTQWGIQGITRHAKFGPGTEGTVSILSDGTLFIGNGGSIQMQDVGLSSNWFVAPSNGNLTFLTASPGFGFYVGNHGAYQFNVQEDGIHVTGLGSFSGALSASNLSGTNTGDETSATVVAKIAAQPLAPASATATGSIKSTGATAGIGYGTGAGGTIAQATSKSTGVTLNTITGKVTMNAAALAAAAVVSFTVTNSAVAATDTINLNLASGNATAGTYRYWIDKVSAGSFVIAVENRSGGSLSEALAFNYAVIKGVAS